MPCGRRSRTGPNSRAEKLMAILCSSGQLHPAVSGEVSGSGRADIVQPVLTVDAVHLGLFAEGVLKKLLLRVSGSAELTVHLGVVESLFTAAAGRRRLLPLGGQHSTAAAARVPRPRRVRSPQLADRCASWLSWYGNFHSYPAAWAGRWMQLAQLLVAGAVIRRAAVGADHDVVLEGERLGRSPHAGSHNISA